MSETNKSVVQRFYDLYNQGAWDQLDNLISADYIHHNNNNHLNLAQFKRGAAWFRAGMPDFQIVIEDMVTEADKVAVRFTGHGTHLGSLYSETPTSKPVVIYGMMVHRVQNNLIVEDWETVDEHDFLKQIVAIAPES
jgi:steroid delta-isomerase-like uncharacterized protein